MNVREMIQEIPRRYPDAVIRTDFEQYQVYYVETTLQNGWKVGFGYGPTHYCSTRVGQLTDPADATTVEIGIFRPDGSWHVPEGASASPDGTTGVLGWQTSDQVFGIIEYIQEMDGS